MFPFFNFFFPLGMFCRGSFSLGVTEHPLFLCIIATYFEKMSSTYPVRLTESVTFMPFFYFDFLHSVSSTPLDCVCLQSLCLTGLSHSYPEDVFAVVGRLFHTQCCNNLDVHCSRQEGTDVAPAHLISRSQNPSQPLPYLVTARCICEKLCQTVGRLI